MAAAENCVFFLPRAPYVPFWNFTVKLKGNQSWGYSVVKVAWSTVFDWYTYPCDGQTDVRRGDSI